MKKYSYLFISLSASLILFLVLFFTMPKEKIVPSVKGEENLESNIVIHEDLNTDIQHYEITEELIEKFQRNKILNYGRWNPVLYKREENVQEDAAEDVSENNSQGSTNEPAFVLNLLSKGALPVRNELYTISSPYGQRNDPFTGESSFHSGVDISKLNEEQMNIIEGTPAYAILNGKVSYVGQDDILGRSVTIEHSHGGETVYAHLESIAVKEGDTIRTGQEIGKIGDTGKSTGPHLHLGVKDNGRFVDPEVILNYIQKRLK